MNSKKRFALIISVAMVLAMFIFIVPVVYVPPPTPHYGSGCPQNSTLCTGFSGSAQSMYYSVSEVLLKVGGCYWSSGGSGYYGVSLVSCPEFLFDYGATNFPCYWIFCVWWLKQSWAYQHENKSSTHPCSIISSICLTGRWVIPHLRQNLASLDDACRGTELLAGLFPQANFATLTRK